LVLRPGAIALARALLTNFRDLMMKRVGMVALTYALVLRAQDESASAKQYLKDLVSPLAFLGGAGSAGTGQWRERPPEWQEGGEGFARSRRAGSNFAISVGVNAGMNVVREFLKK
jgi:hypothetical protein